MSPVDHQRAELRLQKRQLRRALTEEDQERAAWQLARQLSTLPLFRGARHLGLYVANDGEIDPGYILSMAQNQGKSCYLPRLSKLKWRPMVFAKDHPEAVYELNRFGIPEPKTSHRNTLIALELDLLLLPLVAFDTKGNRLGMGGGYYDRTLSHLNRQKQWRRPRVIGLAHELQKVDQLKNKSWDVTLDGIITDQHFYPASIDA